MPRVSHNLRSAVLSRSLGVVPSFLAGVRRALAAFAFGAVLFLVLRIWNGGSWGLSVLHGKYPAGWKLLPWAQQALFALAFVVVGFVISLARMRTRGPETVQPWLVSGGLLYTLFGIAVSAVEHFRILTVGTDASGMPETYRLTRWSGVTMLVFGIVLLLIARSDARNSRRSQSTSVSHD
jgi:hypothetical protein